MTGTVAPIGSFTSGGRPPYSYNSAGALKLKVWTGNVGVETKPTPDLNIDFAVRAEEYKTSGYNKAVYVNNLVNQTTGVVAQVLGQFNAIALQVLGGREGSERARRRRIPAGVGTVGGQFGACEDEQQPLRLGLRAYGESKS